MIDEDKNGAEEHLGVTSVNASGPAWTLVGMTFCKRQGQRQAEGRKRQGQRISGMVAGQGDGGRGEPWGRAATRLDD